MNPRSPQLLPLVALVIGAIAMGGSVIFVRFADVGPFASAFWRVFLALPFLYIWARYDAQKTPKNPTAKSRAAAFKSSFSWPVLLSGLFFSGDLIFWHLSIMNTSVANATFWPPPPRFLSYC